MGFLKLLLLTSLISITIAKYNIDTDIVIPISYNISVTPHIERIPFLNFSGDSYINLKIHLTTSIISLDILGIRLNEKKTLLISKNGTTYKVSNYIYQVKKHFVDISFNNPLSPGSYTLYVQFKSNELKEYENSLYRHFSKNKQKHEVWVCQKPFPSIVIPSSSSLNNQYKEYQELPSIFEISVIHLYGYIVLSNMAVQETSKKYQGMVFTRFKKTPSMSSTSVMITVSNFYCLSNRRFTMNICHAPYIKFEMEFAHTIAVNITQHIAYIQHIPPDQVSKVDIIVMPKLPTRYLANKGLILYNERDIIYDRNKHPTSRILYVASLIADGLLQQTFANLVHSDSWLSSGIGTFFQKFILDKIFPRSQIMDVFVINKLQGSLNTDDYISMESEINNDHRINHIQHDVNYAEMAYSLYKEKGPVIIRMLQHVVTPEIFRKGIEIYLRIFQFSSFSIENLWTAMQIALKQTNDLNRKLNIKKVMDSWVKQRHYPLVQVMHNYLNGEITIIQEDSNHGKDENVGNETKWWIPVTFTTENETNFTDTSPKLWLNPSHENVTFFVTGYQWLIINIQQTGYYRVNYDPANWNFIAKYLNSDKYKKIHVLNRAQLIDDAFYFMFHNNLKARIFFKIISYLRQETDYIAWYSMFNVLFQLQIYFDLPESSTIKSPIAQYFDAILEKLEDESVSNEDYMGSMKYHDVAHWACILGNAHCLKMASIKLENHITNPDRPVLTPDLYKWMYCFGLKTSGKYLWDKVWHLYKQIHDPKLLEFLACSEDPYIIGIYLNFISSNNTIMSDTHREIAFGNIVRRHSRTDYVLGNLLDNFKKLRPKSMGACNALKDIISNVYVREQITKIKRETMFIIKEKCKKKLDPIINDRINYIKDLKNEYARRILN